MAEQDDLTDAKAKEEIEAKAKDLRKKSRSIAELIDDEKKGITGIKTFFVISIILFLLSVVGIILTNEPTLFFFVFIFFVAVIAGIIAVRNRKIGKYYYIDSYSIAEQYKYYLNKLAELLIEYIKRTDKEAYRREIRYCINNFYNFTTRWYNPPEYSSTSILIDLFTKNLDEFNYKLRIFLIRLDGFIDKLENVPRSVPFYIQKLRNGLDREHFEYTPSYLDTADQLIRTLEAANPNCYSVETYESNISKAIRKFWHKTRKLILGLFVWFAISVIYWACVTWIDTGMTVDTKFQSYAVLMAGITPVLYWLFKGR